MAAAADGSDVGGAGRRRGRAAGITVNGVAVFACAVTGLTAGGCSGTSGSGRTDVAVSAADALLAGLRVQGRAPKTGYRRTQFGSAWADTDHNGCDTRDDILARDLTARSVRAGTSGCVVLAGTLADPYTARSIRFSNAAAEAVQIDHVVALSDAWQTGASSWPAAKRLAFANDPLNLLAVDGRTNQAKGDADAASWLPPNRSYRCAYVARQVGVKAKYALWVTAAERDALVRVLAGCPGQPAPRGGNPTLAPAAGSGRGGG